MKLTEAEAAVVIEAARGLSNGEIARRLSLRETTVKSRLALVYRKLGIHSRLQLIALFRP